MLYRTSKSFPKDKPAHLITESFNFLWFLGVTKFFCELKEILFALLGGGNSFFNQLDQDAIVTEAPALGDPLHLFSNPRWEAHATTDKFIERHDPFYTIVVQNDETKDRAGA